MMPISALFYAQFSAFSAGFFLCAGVANGIRHHKVGWVEEERLPNVHFLASARTYNSSIELIPFKVNYLLLHRSPFFYQSDKVRHHRPQQANYIRAAFAYS